METELGVSTGHQENSTDRKINTQNGYNVERQLSKACILFANTNLYPRVEIHIEG